MIGVIAAPCLAPFVVALLAFVGQTGNPWLGWWLFFALALGLGLPYVVLGTFSGLLTRLPKSGVWMVWVKRVFGVALFAVIPGTLIGIALAVAILPKVVVDDSGLSILFGAAVFNDAISALTDGRFAGKLAV